jgi:hypothetical protein
MRIFVPSGEPSPAAAALVECEAVSGKRLRPPADADMEEAPRLLIAPIPARPPRLLLLSRPPAAGSGDISRKSSLDRTW